MSRLGRTDGQGGTAAEAYDLAPAPAPAPPPPAAAAAAALTAGSTALNAESRDGGEAMVGYSPSLNLPLSSLTGGDRGVKAGRNGDTFERDSLNGFMETLEPSSPDGRPFQSDERQRMESNSSMASYECSLFRRGTSGNDNGNGGSGTGCSASSSCGCTNPSLRLHRGGGKGGNTWAGAGAAGASSPTTLTTLPEFSSGSFFSSSDVKTPRSGTHRRYYSARAGRLSPSLARHGSSSSRVDGRKSIGRGRYSGVASGSGSPKRKRDYSHLVACEDENGAPSPFPTHGGSKNTSRALSNSSLSVQRDGSYMQVTFDETHRFADEDRTMNALGVSLMNDRFLTTPEPIGDRRDIDQALSLLQLSGGSGLQPDLTLSASRNSGQESGVKDTPVPSGGLFSQLNLQDEVENMVPEQGTTLAGKAASASAAGSSSLATTRRGSATSTSAVGSLASMPSAALLAAQPPLCSHQKPAQSMPSPSRSPLAGHRLSPLLPPTQTANGDENGGKRKEWPRFGGGGSGGDEKRKGCTGGKASVAASASASATSGSRAKGKPKAKGAVGGQRPAVQAPVSKPQGTKGGGPGSFCSKPEALSQLDTSQSDQMVLDADLWIVRERGDVCSSNECIYKDKKTGISSRRHYHATCDHRHKEGGPKGGMRFHHHQLEKIQKHQRAHIRTLHKKTPAEAVLTDGNVEPYLPKAWTEQETAVLEHLVGVYGPANWAIISAGVATKTETQCMLHWRYALNGNATVKGTGTWQSVEDERMLSLVQIFGQRWSTVAEHMPGRLAKQCRERYLNNLDPELRRGSWSREEDRKLLQLRGQENESFAKISEQIEGRSYNDIKNRWSQISRQIAALKKASRKGASGEDSSQLMGLAAAHASRKLVSKNNRDAASEAVSNPVGLSAVVVQVPMPAADNGSTTTTIAQKLQHQHQHWSRGRGGGGGDCERSRHNGIGRGAAEGGSSRGGHRNALPGGGGASSCNGGGGGGGGMKKSKYRVCMQGGIPTLLETEDYDEAGAGVVAGLELSPHAPSPRLAGAAAAVAGVKEESISLAVRERVVRHKAEISPARATGGISSEESSRSASLVPRSVFMGMDQSARGGGGGGGAEFGRQMAETEANTIAVGGLLRYGNDMSFSI